MTIRYSLGGNAGTKTFLDLGSEAATGAPSLLGQDVEVIGSAGDNTFFLRQAGFTFTFVEGADQGSNTIYLTGNREDYTATTSVVGEVTLERGTGSTAETVRLAASSATTIIFANGALTADLVQAGTAAEPTLNAGITSTDAPAAGVTDGTIRAAVVGVEDGRTLVGARDELFTAYGNGGIDHVYTMAGSQVDASLLGARQDKIFFQGAWADYTTRTREGLLISFGRTYTDSFAQSFTENITVSGGFGGSNDRLVFSDGAIDSNDVLMKMIDGTIGHPLGVEFDTSETSAGPAIGFINGGGLNIVDTGFSTTDGLTNEDMTVEGIVPGFSWGYSLDGGTSWTEVRDGTRSFSLTLPATPVDGVTYQPGDIQVRQYNPYQLASDIIENQTIIRADTVASDTLTIDAKGMPLRPEYAQHVTKSGASAFHSTSMGVSGQNAMTVEAWVFVSQSAFEHTSSNLIVFNFGNSTLPGLILKDGRFDTRVGDGSQFLDLTAAAPGWNFVSVSRTQQAAGTGVYEFFVLNSANEEGFTKVADSSLSWSGTANLIRVGGIETGTLAIDGGLSDVRVWGIDRSELSMADRLAPPAPTATGLINHWRMDDSSSANSAANSVAGQSALLVGNGSPAGTVTFGATTTASGAAGAPSQSVSAAVFTGDGAEAHAEVSIQIGGSVVGTGQADATGKWVVQLSTPVTAGSHEVSAFQTDLAGNNSAIKTGQTLTFAADADFAAKADISPGDDTGASDTDNITSDRKPFFSGSGVFVGGTASQDTVELIVNGTQQAKHESSDNSGVSATGLTVNRSSGDWNYSPPSDFVDGTYVLVIRNTATGRESQPLVFTVDTAIAQPTIDTWPQSINPGEDIVLVGTAGMEPETKVTVEVDDGDPATVGDPKKEDISVELVDGKWTTTFTAAELQGLSDGDVTVTATATDVAGNALSITQVIPLDLVNQAPVTNTVGAPAQVDVGLGASAGTVIFDVNDVRDDGAGTQDDVLFSDADTLGTSNATLTYTLAVQGGGQVPSWLTIEDGMLKVATGESAPVSAETHKLIIVATDGSGVEAQHNIDVAVNDLLPLTVLAKNSTNLDVRSDIVLDGGEALQLGGPGVYEIKLTDTQASVAGFGDETSNGTIIISVTLDGANAISGMSINGTALDSAEFNNVLQINGNAAIINPTLDLDLGTVYDLSVSAGLFQAVAGGNKDSRAISGVTFETLTPTVGGAVATTWDGSAMVDGATWYDGTGGTYSDNNSGQTFDLAAVEGVVVVGRDTATAADTITLDSSFRTSLIGFSGNDALYVDQDNGDPRNTVTVDNVTISQVGSTGVGTILQFSSNGELGGAIITFADRAGDPNNLTESALEAYQFKTVSPAIPDVYGFEDLTGNASPVLSG